MLDWRITSHHPSDTLGTAIRYCSADLYNTYTMYHPPDVRWHVLNDTMSQYYLCYYRILGLNGVPLILNEWKSLTSIYIMSHLVILVLQSVGKDALGEGRSEE